MLVYVEGKSFLGRTFVLSCDSGDTVGRLKSLLLHILHDLGRSDHFFRLRFGNSYLREPLTLKDYNICEMSVLQMVPILFGHHARATTTAGVPRPFTSLIPHNVHTLTNSSRPLSSETLMGAQTRVALRKEVNIFQRREWMLQALRGMLWALLTSVIVSFATVYWWSGFWIGVTVVLSLYLMPNYLHVGGTMGRMTEWDKRLIAVYSGAFVIVTTVNLVMFVYLLVAVVIKGDCSSFPDPNSLLGCSHRLWLSLALFPLQSLILLTSSVTALSLLINFTFEAGQLVEPTLTKVKEVKQLLQIAQEGSVKDRRQVAFELSNIALLGGKSKEQIAADGGLQLLTSMMSGDDEVTQEYAVEAIAEILSFSLKLSPKTSSFPAASPDYKEPTPIQVEFVSQGGVATLCALLHSTNLFVAEKAGLSLSYLTATCLGNRMAVSQERGLDDLQRIFTKSHPEMQLLVCQIVMHFAMCSESRSFLLDHDTLLDSLVGVLIADHHYSRGAVKAYSLTALLELGREDKGVILKRPRLIKGLLDLLSLSDVEMKHSSLQILTWYATDTQGMKQLLLHSNLLSSLQKLVHSSAGDVHLAVVLIRLLLIMLKVRQYRAKLVFMGMRDLLVNDEVRDSWNAMAARNDEISSVLSECWEQFNTF